MPKLLSFAESIERIDDGSVIMIGGFMGVGSPMRLISELVRQRKRDLTLISNDTARPNVGVGQLVSARAVRKVITSHIGTNPETQSLLKDRQIEVELVPQGTLVERIRASGYGLGGVLTPTGLGTFAEQGKQVIEVEGRRFVLETPLRAQFALINARKADHFGNLTYALTARNFNPVMAMAADTVIAEAQELVPVGVIPPDEIVTPAVLVDVLAKRG